MNTSKDLVVLVADKDMRSTIEGILTQPARLRIRPIRYDIFEHPRHDPGCLRDGVDFLRRYMKHYEYAIIMFDREGCGRENCSRESIEEGMEAELSANGWARRAAVIVIDPELESWIWSPSPHVDKALGWDGKQPPLRAWLKQRGYLADGHFKPNHPKTAVEVALRHSKIPRSSSIYRQIASKVGFEQCTDAAFGKLRKTVYSWFPLS